MLSVPSSSCLLQWAISVLGEQVKAQGLADWAAGSGSGGQRQSEAQNRLDPSVLQSLSQLPDCLSPAADRLMQHLSAQLSSAARAAQPYLMYGPGSATSRPSGPMPVSIQQFKQLANQAVQSSKGAKPGASSLSAQGMHHQGQAHATGSIVSSWQLPGDIASALSSDRAANQAQEELQAGLLEQIQLLRLCSLASSCRAGGSGGLRPAAGRGKGLPTGLDHDGTQATAGSEADR